MMKMINKRRVQRIKNLIYAFIILLMLLPLVLMSILSFQMFGAIKDLNVKVDNLSKFASSQTVPQNPAEAATPDSGYVIEPSDQASRPTDEQTQEATEPQQTQGDSFTGEVTADENLLPSKENLSAFPDGDAPIEVFPDADKPSPADSGNELGGGAPIESSEGEYLAAAGGGSLGAADGSSSNAVDSSSPNAADKQLDSNPQMGYGDSAPSSDYTINPSTGS